ncbi:membrane protein insertase YidC [Pseudoclavibacter sp. CFCC 13796]|uniref:membrane protein insertase YidC n=1 Tax=Pseudoclavibacter sp. CFCC 13796 TaxID=2615179 RepID=UPI0013013B8C|nr:membrane protein insertase YidC [Pseudoclavibacter sp. CFCC 13796]KAB1660709.1 membrane protein insertase YidC [Pseudoclavibacter sp. CFCC 13796]
MDLIGSILWPIKWLIELVLVSWHWVWVNIFGMGASSGWAWTLSIIGLVLIVRAAMIPLFVKQIKSSRASMELAPKVRALQQKYKGKKDQLSRQAMAQEQMALYKDAGTNPMAGCLPMLVQMPVFFGLYTVLHEAAQGHSGIGVLNGDLANDFQHGSIFGAQLSTTLMNSINADPIQWQVVLLAVVLVIFMVSSQLYTSIQIMGKNISEETKASPMFRQQKMLMYGMPFLMIFSGVAFPIGLLIYWFTSNLWTMVQQAIVIRSMPTPGSVAYFARQSRLEAKGKLTDRQREELAKHEGRGQGQRQQPVGKSRAKKQGGQLTDQQRDGAADAKSAESDHSGTASASAAGSKPGSPQGAQSGENTSQQGDRGQQSAGQGKGKGSKSSRSKRKGKR